MQDRRNEPQTADCEAKAYVGSAGYPKPSLPGMLKKLIGEMVNYTPPQDCRGRSTLDFYPAIITQVNPDGSCELTTFGPNSLYFQHGIHFSEHQRENTFSLRAKS